MMLGRRALLVGAAAFGGALGAALWQRLPRYSDDAGGDRSTLLVAATSFDADGSVLTMADAAGASRCC